MFLLAQCRVQPQQAAAPFTLNPAPGCLRLRSACRGAVCLTGNNVPEVRGAPTPRDARRALVAQRAEQTTGPQGTC